jgi:regulator of protease activity HflC (stomatin/prohibitin superfamily)
MLLLTPFVARQTITIADNEVGLRFDFLSGDLEGPLYPGVYGFNPQTQDITIYPTDQQIMVIDEEDAVSARTRDGVAVVVTGSLAYRINPEQILMIHSRWQNRYEMQFIRPIMRRLVRDAIAELMIGELTADSTAVTQSIHDTLAENLAREGLLLDELQTETSISPG